MPETSSAIPGTLGYEAEARDLASLYETMSFEDVHADILPLLPGRPARVLDVGAGSGRDAAWLARAGHDVTAVEPVEAFRKIGRSLHPVPELSWVDDALPYLSIVMKGNPSFDFILLSAVWMHLGPQERAIAMSMLARILSPDGILVITLRHGDAAPGRVMHDVGRGDTEALAARNGLIGVMASGKPDRLGRSGVSWSTLAFRRR